MCTLVLLRRPDHEWPVLLAANRDEMMDRPSSSPARHWPDRPDIVAGKDELSDGSWLGINDFGVVAAILNRTGSLGPADNKRSRGELVLEALDHADAQSAAQALADIDPTAYRSFNLVIADNRDGYWLASRNGAISIESHPIPEGYSIFTSQDRNEIRAPRIGTYLPRFEAAEIPDPAQGEWSQWEALMATRLTDDQPRFDDAMCIVTDHGYGTVSSSLIALPAPAPAARAHWRFANGRPDIMPYEVVLL
jgi:hypothetical protein